MKKFWIYSSNGINQGAESIVHLTHEYKEYIYIYNSCFKFGKLKPRNTHTQKYIKILMKYYKKYYKKYNHLNIVL